MSSTTSTDAASREVITSLLTEHLRYTPLTVLDDIINTVNEIVYRSVEAVEQGLNGAPAASLGFDVSKNTDDGPSAAHNPDARAEIEDGVHQLETLLETTVDKNFDKLEIYVLRNILSVPEDVAPYMRLRHYENLDFTTPQHSTPSPTPDTLAHLRLKLHETRKLHHALQSEQARNAATLARLRTLASSTSSSLAFLAQAAQSQSQPQSPNPAAVLAQLPALRESLAALRETTEGAAGLTAHAARGAEVRRGYIEGQARRVLEGQGVDVVNGTGGGGGGARMGGEEVAAIEGIAAALAAAGAAADAAGGDKMEE